MRPLLPPNRFENVKLFGFFGRSLLDLPTARAGSRTGVLLTATGWAQGSQHGARLRGSVSARVPDPAAPRLCAPCVNSTDSETRPLDSAEQGRIMHASVEPDSPRLHKATTERTTRTAHGLTRRRPPIKRSIRDDPQGDVGLSAVVLERQGWADEPVNDGLFVRQGL
jgi:hypothetical protein